MWLLGRCRWHDDHIISASSSVHLDPNSLMQTTVYQQTFFVHSGKELAELVGSGLPTNNLLNFSTAYDMQVKLGFRVPKGFGAPGLRAKNYRAPRVQDRKIGALRLQISTLGLRLARIIIFAWAPG